MMIQKKHAIVELSIVFVILLNFTKHAHSFSDDNTTHSTVSVTGNPDYVNTTANTIGWMYTVDLLKDDCLNDFISTGRTIKTKFSQLVDLYKTDNKNEISDSSARTFGLRKRIMSMALPLMFKLGVISTVIFTILVLVIKTVIIGKMILILNIIGIVLKLVSLKKGHDGGGFHHQSQWSIPQKEIHLHIHNNGGHHSSYEPIPSGYSSYGPHPNYATISRSDAPKLVTHPAPQTQKVLQRVIPYDPFSTAQYNSNEYILV